MTRHGWKDASMDEGQVRKWWAQTPDANVAIACNPSNLCVVDIDHGLDSLESFVRWAEATCGAEAFTYSVRTGRRPEFGVQLYFNGAIPDVGMWKHNGCEGQVKSLGGYVMARGSVHPDSGETYQWLTVSDAYLQPTPDWVRELKPERQANGSDDGSPITSNRNVALTSIAGKLRNAGLTHAALEVSLLQVNVDRCIPSLEEEEVKRIAANAANWAPPEPEIKVTIGKPEESVDWRTRYMTEDTFQNVKPPEFLIDGFLAKRSVAMLAGPVAQRKSIIALNIAHALCTGEPLFGYFDVPGGHDRVV
jgi:hypothetical protein